MNIVARLLNKLTMYRLMLYCMGILVGAAIILSILDILPYSPSAISLQTVAFVLVCWGINEIIARVLKIQPNGESSVITALILTSIVGPLSLPEQWPILIITAGAAITSKYVFAWRRSHIFNPTAFGVLASALALGYPASWWIGSQPLVPVILAGGVLVLWKIRRWHLIGSFLLTYLGLLVIDGFFVQSRSLSEMMFLIQSLLTSAALLFFVFVMLVEPLTAPQTRSRRIAFGVVVGGVLFLLQRTLVHIPYSLELALLIGNIFARIVNPDFRQVFRLQRKELFSSSIENFWFQPTRPFAFAPGQFLEYTFAHARPDSRGVRRYFTIASSPTEKEVLLTARFSQPGSTFKRALRNIKQGDGIVASKVAGDFVLPTNAKQKLVFIAGGIGITPFRSIVKYLLDTNEKRDIVLLYGARGTQDLVFQDIFAEAEKKFGMQTRYVLSSPDEKESGIGGVIDAALIQSAVPDFRERLFYISGPEPMVQSIIKIIRNIGVSRRYIKRDYFPGYDN
ncbi:MAG: RnfABCDGE type electron transport complex subunit D [Candidatus Andersenbacteria bacterium]|nr:RnfABCDGE type electron transport complex subunit D [Candidatus Andersenbacteria bacterium]